MLDSGFFLGEKITYDHMVRVVEDVQKYVTTAAAAVRANSPRSSNEREMQAQQTRVGTKAERSKKRKKGKGVVHDDAHSTASTLVLSFS